MAARAFHVTVPATRTGTITSVLSMRKPGSDRLERLGQQKLWSGLGPLTPKPLAYALEKAPLRPGWQVSPLLEKPSVNSCPQGPLFQGNTLVFLPSFAHERYTSSLLCSRVARFLEVSLTVESVSRCFAHRASSWSPGGGRTSHVWERVCPLDGARWL